MVFFIALTGILSVFLIGLAARPIGEFLGIMDNPKSEQHKLHSQPTPLVGAILVSTALAFLVLDRLLSNGGDAYFGSIAWISVAAFVIGVLGVVDDRVKLSWHIRFIALWLIVGGLLVAVPDLILSELRWSWGQTTELGTIGGAAFTALCLVGLVIALNMMDGFNGGVLSQCLIWSLIFALLAGVTGQAAYLYIAATIAVILGFNLRGKLFLGDGGAYALGILMGASAIITYTQDGSPAYADTIVVWLALPVFDCLRVIFRRKLSGESPFLPQRDHLHHLMMGIKGPKLALLFTAGFGAVFGTLSVLAPEKSYLLVLIQLSTIAAAVVIAKKRPALSRAPAE